MKLGYCSVPNVSPITKFSKLNSGENLTIGWVQARQTIIINDFKWLHICNILYYEEEAKIHYPFNLLIYRREVKYYLK